MSSKATHKTGKITFGARHICKLDHLELQRELPCPAPFAPICKKFLYNLKRWTIANRHHPRSSAYFRSDFALFKEQRRQLRQKRYKRIIHPLSRFAMVRQIIICALWVIIFITEPLFEGFLASYIRQRNYFAEDLFRLILNLMFLVDIILQFFLGFTVDRTKEIVLDHKRIVNHYLTSYFLYDMIPTVFGILNFIVTIKTVKTLFGLPELIQVWLSIPQLYCLRFVRIYTMAHFFSNLLNFMKIRESIVKCATIILVVVIIIHWWTCALYLIPVISYYVGYPFSHSWVLRAVLGTRRTIANIYIECLLNTVCHFFGAGKGNISTTNAVELFILSFILINGLICHIYVIAVILQLFGTINVSETKYEELIYQLNEYMMSKKLPQPLRKRLLMYYEYRFQKQYFLESAILSSLSEHLRYEVLLYSCKNLITKVKLFQGAPKEVIGALIAMLKHEIFLPNDIIIKRDSLNEHIYFISFGTVAVYLPNGKEAFHLEDGHHFGEEHAILQQSATSSMVNVIAIEITEVFYLEKKDFWYIIANYPDISDSLEKSALTKIETYHKLQQGSTDSFVDTNDILMELRKGRILDKRRRRP